jgi:hypothetical protein
MTKSMVNAAAVYVLTLAIVVATPIATYGSDGDNGKDDRGGKLSFMGGFGLNSPCVPEALNTNNVNVSVTVSADVEKRHESVDVRVRFSGPASGDMGGVYNLSGSGQASYSTANANFFTYKFPIRLDVDGVNGTPSFTAFLELGMFVDGNQNPVRLFVGGGELVCDLN